MLEPRQVKTLAVVMPYVLAWNRTAIEQKMARLAAYLGLPEPSFESALEWIMEFRS